MNAIRMKRSRAEGFRAQRDAGFSMTALVIFLTAASIMLTISVPSYVMQARREKEKELIFRGEEYARAIQKYQRTLNLLPTSVDELLSSNGTRFLRKAYADPVTGEPWRVIILNTDGTLTGSNVYQTLGQVPTTTSVRNTAAAAPATGAGNTGGRGSSNGSLATTNPLTGAGTSGLGAGGGGGLGGAGGGLGGAGTGVAGGATAGGTRGGTGAVTPTQPAAAQPQQQATPLSGIVGVGSASKGTGVLVYEKQEQYSNWEFIAVLQQRGTPASGGGGNAPAPSGAGGGTRGGGGGTPGAGGGTQAPGGARR